MFLHRISANTPIVLADDFRGSLPLSANAEIRFGIGNDCFLSNYFLFLLRTSSHRLVLYSCATDSGLR